MVSLYRDMANLKQFPVAGLDELPRMEVLSPYSRKICGLIVQGLTSQEIALQVGSNSAAIDVTVSRAMQRIGVRTRAALAVWFVVSMMNQPS